MDRHSWTKKSLCVYEESQSCMGRKQAEKATLLETWTLSSEIGKNDSEDGARSHRGLFSGSRTLLQSSCWWHVPSRFHNCCGTALCLLCNSPSPTTFELKCLLQSYPLLTSVGQISYLLRWWDSGLREAVSKELCVRNKTQGIQSALASDFRLTGSWPYRLRCNRISFGVAGRARVVYWVCLACGRIVNYVDYVTFYFQRPL